MSDKDVLKETRPRMETVIEDFKRKLATVRTGRAAVSLLDTVLVDYYGTLTPLSQLASVHAPEPQMLTVQPWDQSQITAVEKAIRTADLGLNPSNDGKLVRIPIPPLTEERRKQLAKQVHDIAEDHRTAIRNVRRDSNEKLKKMLKDKLISEDAERDGLDEIQKLTNTFITKIDELSKTKEIEITSV
ncbi:MAG TPA: ribosome recycling factor [Pyrinomonadaceae bacterium]|jgi:ribosome recycling factor|nr:ribosome recycling factor [Pyrinomonadaceae bacterium]